MDNLNVTNLLNWFDTNKKEYPWNRNKTPYLVWISEIMLQQTVAATVIPYFEKWSLDYPDVNTLAAAELNEVLGSWEGLGYYSRCRNIHKAAKLICDSHKSGFPDTYKGLTALPGIGDYTARAILSIAYKKPYALLDANVKRIMQRLTATETWDKKQEKQILTDLEAQIPHERPGDFNEAIMQLGQIVCTTGSPRCTSCPLKEGCRAEKEGKTQDIPLKKTKNIKRNDKTVLILYSKGKILLRMKKKGLFQDMWMLPSADADTCHEENWIKQQLAQNRAIKLKKRIHFYTDNKETLSPCLITCETINLTDIKPEDNEFFTYKWIDLKEIDTFPSPSVYRKIINDIKDLL
jgi:A/G-specific adenine glycosylase